MSRRVREILRREPGVRALATGQEQQLAMLLYDRLLPSGGTSMGAMTTTARLIAETVQTPWRSAWNRRTEPVRAYRQYREGLRRILT